MLSNTILYRRPLWHRASGITALFIVLVFIQTMRICLANAQTSANCSCPNGGTLSVQTVYVPYTLENGHAGDTLLHSGATGSMGSGNIVPHMLRLIGFSYTHSMLITADGANGLKQEVSHFTAHGTKLASLFSKKDLRLDADKLAHLPPGLVKQNFDSIIRDYGLNLSNAQVLIASDRNAAQSAVQAARKLSGSYRIQAYTDLSYINHVGPGTHCSGFVYWAWQRGGGGSISPVQYYPSFRANAGDVLYQGVYNAIMSEGVPILPDAWTAKRVANQIVNCFLDRACNATDDGWRADPRIGYTVAPDDLLPRAGNSAYASVERVVTSGGYYDDRDVCQLPGGDWYEASCTPTPPPSGGNGHRPVASTLNVNSDTSGNIVFSYTLSDAEGDLLKIIPEYSADGGTTWSNATAGPGGEPKTDLHSSESGVTHTFVWASHLQGIGIMTTATNVAFRITPSDGLLGKSAISNTFTVDNTDRRVECRPVYQTSGYCGDFKCDPTICETIISCNRDCGYCGDGICGVDETADPGGNCAKDCGKCGDGICMANETTNNCVADCSKGCGDNICRPEAGENEETCPTDCSNCGNGVQNEGETCANCPQDVANTPVIIATPSKVVVNQPISFTTDTTLISGVPTWDFGDATNQSGVSVTHNYRATGSYHVVLSATENNCQVTKTSLPFVIVVTKGDDCGGFCGDDVCCDYDYEETPLNCPQDCVCGSHQGYCGDGVCCNIDGEDYSTCPSDCPIVCDVCGNDFCGECENAENCSQDCINQIICGDHVCDSSEGCENCPSDCGKCIEPCGDGYCTPGIEDCGTCTQDCACRNGTKCSNRQCITYCGNNTCDEKETYKTCPQDCAAPQDECSKDDDCGSGKVCELSTGCDHPLICVSGCHNKSQCPDGSECKQLNCITCPCAGICTPVSLSCGAMGGDFCSNTGKCPQGYDNLGASYDCSPCCKQGDSCGAMGGNYCSNDGKCPRGYDVLGVTYDCTPCCKQGPSCGAMGGDYCGNDLKCPKGYISLGSSYDCNPCCKQGTL
ncbi:MAG: PKD domain-containing protein [Deltaproteobacteria bacterium]|nr:PKD domain-containing protein [Deltaproteobacteria bacterium]